MESRRPIGQHQSELSLVTADADGRRCGGGLR